MLYSRRKRLAELATREAAGESFWTDKFDGPVRNKLILASRFSAGNWEDYNIYAREAILHDEGKFFLHDRRMDPTNDLLNFLLTCDDDMMPTVIEAISHAFGDEHINGLTGNWVNARAFDQATNVILREHRISYELISRQMIPFAAKELHEEVMAPALRLLAGRPDLDRVESAYRCALEEIAGGKPGDAITDAGTALQEMLSSLGCAGNSLGPLISSAKSKRILAPHDSPMLAAVEKILHWVSADRSETGDAHGVTSATLDDAWFIVHVVGAVILRLSKPVPRGG